MPRKHALRRALVIVLIGIITVALLGAFTAAIGAGPRHHKHRVHTRKHTTTKKKATKKKATKKKPASAARKPTTTTTTTTKPRAVVTSPTSVTAPPAAAPSASPSQSQAPPAAPASAPCVGVPMTNGQSDINAHGPNTTFCLSGVHNWTLTPKSGDRFVGPAVLDGGHGTRFAFEVGSADNVTIENLEIRNYNPGAELGAIQSDGSAGSSWVLRNLQVHDNGSSAGGAGATLGAGWQVLGGRYYNNRQEGLFDSRGDGAVIDGVELDHNNFTDNSYSTRNVSCSDEAGGIKFLADNVTIRNSSVHDNACVGIWSDGNARNSTIANNRVYNNWNEGIFIEISDGSLITGNTVTGNGQKGGGGSNSFGCDHWMYGAGIVAASSANVTVAGNTVSGNCNGITGTQEPRPDGNPGRLMNFSVHDNTISGPGRSGVKSWPIVDLNGRGISFANNSASGGMTLCTPIC